MEKIAVLHGDNFYWWVDTVVMTDEYENALAVLVSPFNGSVCMRITKTIRVIDKNIIDNIVK